MNNKEFMYKDFKTETMELISELGASVIAYKLRRRMDPFIEKEYEEQEYQGKGKINWEEIPEQFLKYNDGYGTQYWQGIILLDNGTWLTRGEYDGSEWWDYHKLPTIQEVLEEDIPLF